MAISSVDQLIAGMQPGREFMKVSTPSLTAGRPQSLFYLGGNPGAAAAPSPGVAGAALTSYAGQLIFGNPAAGNAYLARFSATAGVTGQLLLCDRLWHNSGMSPTNLSAQTINSATWPARDANNSANGDGVLVGVEVSATMGSGTPTLTMTYTNQAGTASRTATNILATAASVPVGSFFPMGLQAGDSGVRSIQDFTLSVTWTSGTFHLVAYRVLARVDIALAYVPGAIDAVTGGMPKAWADTVPFLLFIPSTAAATNVWGSIVWTHG